MRFLFISIVASILIFSCSKEEINEPAPADASIVKYVLESISEEVNFYLNQEGSLNGFADIDGTRGGCASVRISPLGNVFPKVVTIVFPQNCTTYAGAAIEGTVSLAISGRIRDVGTTVDFALTDFKYKTFSCSGNYHIVFDGALSHTTNISFGKIVNATGQTITYSAINTSSQIEGTSTTFRTNPLTFLFDDVYEITTQGEGINTMGNAFTIQTQEPLRYSVGCQWLTSGVIEIIEASKPTVNATIDYGNDTCDNKATLSYNNFVKIITLP